MNTLVCDDHAVLRYGLKKVLTNIKKIDNIIEARTASECLEKFQNERIDLVILDISLPDENGISTLKKIKRNNRDVPILVLTMHPEEDYALRAFENGAHGYLVKDAPPAEIESALNKIISGHKYITDSSAEKLTQKLNLKQDKPLHSKLSNREFEIMLKIARGKSLVDISDELCLSPKTVSTYKLRLLKKMNMKNRAELTQYVLRQKLLS